MCRAGVVFFALDTEIRGPGPQRNAMRSMYALGAVLVLVACGGTKALEASNMTALDSGSVLDFATVTGGVRNAESTKPTCPIIPHYDAVLAVTKLSGTVTYRWERSTGEHSKVFEVKLPDSARTGMAKVPLESDEWLHRVRGLQVTFTDKVHVLTPVDRVSQVMPLDGICY